MCAKATSLATLAAALNLDSRATLDDLLQPFSKHLVSALLIDPLLADLKQLQSSFDPYDIEGIDQLAREATKIPLTELYKNPPADVDVLSPPTAVEYDHLIQLHSKRSDDRTWPRLQ